MDASTTIQYIQKVSTTTYQFMWPHVEPVTVGGLVWDVTQSLLGVVVFLGGIYYGYNWVKKYYAI